MAMKARYTVIEGEVIAEKRNGVRSLYVPDPLGSTVALVDSTQTKTDTFGYWPYGEVSSRTGTTPTPFQFVGTAGYYRDRSDRTYVRARTLDTGKGRWLTKDPIGFRSRDSNLFRYVNNQPFRSDPSGLAAWVCLDPLGGFHQCISTNQCGAWGFNRDPGWCPACPGYIYNCDYKLDEDPSGKVKPGRPARPGMTCDKLPVSPDFERALCGCIERSRRSRHLWYVVIGHNCQNWVYDMLVCACMATHQGNEWYNWPGRCQWHTDPTGPGVGGIP